MKQKTRDQLDRIERMLKELAKEVGRLQVTHHRLSQGNGNDHDDDHDDDGNVSLDKPKALGKAVTKVLGKKRRKGTE